MRAHRRPPAARESGGRGSWWDRAHRQRLGPGSRGAVARRAPRTTGDPSRPPALRGAIRSARSPQFVDYHPGAGSFNFSFQLLVSGGKKRPAGPRTVVSTSYFEFSFPGAKKGLPEGSLWEIVISLSCEQNSARKFQSGVSNSGFQIPKHARQNSEVTENSCFTLQKPVERPQNSSRRFLDSCFCFRVPFRGWNLGRFPFPISRFSVQIQGR